MEGLPQAMIAAIRNQPISFNSTLTKGCVCDPFEPLLPFVPDEDTIRFQMVVGLCPDEASLIDNSDFQGVNWKAGLGWTLFPGEACGSNQILSTLQDDSFVPVVGESYVLHFVVNSTNSIVNWSFGGSGGIFGTLGQPGGAFTQDIYVTATAPASLTITLPTTTSAICFGMIAAYAANRDIEVEFLDAAGAPVASFTPDLDPDYFVFEGDMMSVAIPLAGTVEEGCFSVRVTNTCGVTETILISQQFIAVTDTECTIRLRACNDVTTLGFIAEPLEARLPAKLVHAAWDYEVSEERWSNGRIMRNYSDRQRKMELRIGLVSEHAHEFLSALPLFTHVYLGQDEYVVDAEGYEPLYGDVFDKGGGIVLTVRPKEELLRRVACAAEGPGCVPPPNYLVQRTGPNDDLILTQNAEAIELAL